MGKSLFKILYETLASLALLHGLSVVLLALIIMRGPAFSDADAPRRLKIPYERISMEGPATPILRGWFFPHKRGSPSIILCAGGDTAAGDELDRVPGLVNAGFNVLLFDPRAHGRSDGMYRTLGELEYFDVSAAIPHLWSEHPEPGHDMVIWALSTCGPGALRAAINSGARAIILEEPVEGTTHAIRRWFARKFFGWEGGWVSSGVIRFVHFWNGVEAEQASVRADLPRMAPRPVLVIQRTEAAPEDRITAWLSAYERKFVEVIETSGKSGGLLTREQLDALYPEVLAFIERARALPEQDAHEVKPADSAPAASP
ncbi:MAG: hypothetical protein GMKNLPBB_02985 [Myxococcota bacterium]|nr:hypothetical protein [Myxococcota bacterium]